MRAIKDESAIVAAMYRFAVLTREAIDADQTRTARKSRST
jgi:hypothetical protein